MYQFIDDGWIYVQTKHTSLLTNLFNRCISWDVDIDAVDHAQGSNTKQNGDESNGVLKIIFKIFVKIYEQGDENQFSMEEMEISLSESDPCETRSQKTHGRVIRMLWIASFNYWKTKQ